MVTVIYVISYCKSFIRHWSIHYGVDGTKPDCLSLYHNYICFLQAFVKRAYSSHLNKNIRTDRRADSGRLTWKPCDIRSYLQWHMIVHYLWIISMTNKLWNISKLQSQKSKSKSVSICLCYRSMYAILPKMTGTWCRTETDGEWGINTWLSVIGCLLQV